MAICRAFLMAEAAYTAKDITVLEGLEPVRLRPGMYIGSTGSRGLHHLVYEVVDNSVDEALADRNDLVDVTIHPDNSVTVRDAGAGIPVDSSHEQGLPGADRRPHEAPCRRQVRRRRLQGVRRPARRRRLGRERALRVADRRGPARRQGVPPGVRPRRAHRRHGDDRRLQQGRSGTTISFMPDPEVFDETEFDAATLLTAPARDRVPDARASRSSSATSARAERREEFHYEGGIRDFVAHVNESKDAVTSTSSTSRARRDDGHVEVAMQWNSSYVESVFSFANNINTTRGRRAPVRLPRSAHRDAQPLRARQGAAEGEGGQPRGRGRPRGSRGGHLREAPEPAVRRSDEDEARQPRVEGLVKTTVNAAARRVPRGEPDRARSRSSRRRSRRPARDRRRARRAS